MRFVLRIFFTIILLFLGGILSIPIAVFKTANMLSNTLIHDLFEMRYFQKEEINEGK